jgi:hypothetical protein
VADTEPGEGAHEIQESSSGRMGEDSSGAWCRSSGGGGPVRWPASAELVPVEQEARMAAVAQGARARWLACSLDVRVLQAASRRAGAQFAQNRSAWSLGGWRLAQSAVTPKIGMSLL